jgi:hypothetical protein
MVPSRLRDFVAAPAGGRIILPNTTNMIEYFLLFRLRKGRACLEASQTIGHCIGQS